MSDSVNQPPEDAGPLPSNVESLYFFARISWTPQIEDAATGRSAVDQLRPMRCRFLGLPRVGKSEFARVLRKWPRMTARWHGRRRPGCSSAENSSRSPSNCPSGPLTNLGVRSTARERESLRIRLDGRNLVEMHTTDAPCRCDR